jgi:signal transduction histidine kinase
MRARKRLGLDAGFGSFDEALDAAVRILVDTFGEGAVALAVDASGSVVRAAHHEDAALDVRCAMLKGVRGAERALPQEVRHGERTSRVPLGGDHEHAEPAMRAFFASVRPRHALTVPVKIRGTAVAALWALRSRSEFTADDEATAEELAERVALLAENARLREQTARALERADDAHRAKEEFLQQVSLDLRSPLLAMERWLAALGSDAPPPEVSRPALEVLAASVRAQRRSIEELVALSEGISGRLRLSARTVALGEVLTRIIDELAVACTAKRVTVSVATSPEAVVWGDPERLEQLVLAVVGDVLGRAAHGSTLNASASLTGPNVRLAVHGPLGARPITTPRLEAASWLAHAHGGHLLVGTRGETVVELPRYTGARSPRTIDPLPPGVVELRPRRDDA